MSRALAPDPAEQAASIAAEKRALLLRAYRGWLRLEDLEDCYGQATLELLLRAKRDNRFRCAAHIANALEQKFRSRIHDRRRALAGRSALEAALAGALPLSDPDAGGIDVPDPRVSTEEMVAIRLRLRHVLAVARALSYDQRLVLASQVELDLSAGEFCERVGWSAEKYRKVAQRGRARLRLLADGAPERGRAAAEHARSRPRGSSRRANPVGDRRRPTYEAQHSCS